MNRRTQQVMRLQDLTEYELGSIDAIFYSFGIVNRLPTIEEFDLAMDRLDDFIRQQGSPALPTSGFRAPDPLAAAS